MFAYDLSFKELENNNNKLAVLPVGSLEQHGPYLPLGTDSITAESAAIALEKQLTDKIVVYPTLYYGCSKEHKNFPGTVYFEFDTYLKLISEIFASIFRAGFKSLLVIGGHGGNHQILQVAQINWNYDHPNQKVHYVFAFTDKVQVEGEKIFGSMETHAGSVETSLIYSLSENYQKTTKKKIVDKQFIEQPGESLSLMTSDEICKDGIISSTEEVEINTEKGKMVFEIMVEDLKKHALEIIKLDKSKGKK